VHRSSEITDPLLRFESATPTILEGVGLIGLSLALTLAALTRAAARRLRGQRV
jgi:hypothetical protein